MKYKEQNKKLEDRIKQLENVIKEIDEEKSSCPICFHHINHESGEEKKPQRVFTISNLYKKVDRKLGNQ